VLYEIVTGRPPFAGPNGFAVMLAHQNTAPLSPSEIDPAIDERLSQVILKALEKDPSRRFPNAAAFRDALEKATMSPEFETMPEKRPAATQWRGWIIAAASFGCVLGLAGLIAWAGHITVISPFAANQERETPAAEAPPAAKEPASPPPSEPVVTPPVAAADPVPNAAPVRPRVSRRPAPVPAQPGRPLTITGAEVVEPPPRKMEPKHEESVADIPAPVPVRKQVEIAPELIPAPPAVAPPEVKKPNVLKRAFGRLFGKREKQ